MLEDAGKVHLQRGGDDNDDVGDPGGDPDDFLSAFTDFSSADWSFLDSVDMVAESKKPCPTLRKVPPKHTRKIASVLASVAHLALHSSTATARERALKYWFLLPRLLSLASPCFFLMLSS